MTIVCPARPAAQDCGITCRGHEPTTANLADRPLSAENAPKQSGTRAHLRRLVTARFHISAAWAVVGVGMQIIGVGLATLHVLRAALEPVTPWLLLALAGLVPFARSQADAEKHAADDILRKIELEDGLGQALSPLYVEDTWQDAPWIVHRIAARQPLDPEPFASGRPPSARRLVDNTRESAWWSHRLAREMARWESAWGGLLVIVCIAVLVAMAMHPPPNPAGAARNAAHSPTASPQDGAELAAGLLIFVFAEGFIRRASDLRVYARASEHILSESERLLAHPQALTESAAFSLAVEYYVARQASPRLSSLWYQVRKEQLNAAWARANAASSHV